MGFILNPEMDTGQQPDEWQPLQHHHPLRAHRRDAMALASRDSPHTKTSKTSRMLERLWAHASGRSGRPHGVCSLLSREALAVTLVQKGQKKYFLSFKKLTAGFTPALITKKEHPLPITYFINASFMLQIWCAEADACGELSLLTSPLFYHICSYKISTAFTEQMVGDLISATPS